MPETQSTAKEPHPPVDEQHKDGGNKESECVMPELPPPVPLLPMQFQCIYEPTRYGTQIDVLYAEQS